MEKSVRAAIQRHMRGWAPYPHVRVTATEQGHLVRWGSASDILNASLCMEIDTAGTPSRRDFAILSTHGTRAWEKSDMRIMENDPDLTAYSPWGVSPSPARMAALTLDECSGALEHIRLCWAKNPKALSMLHLVDTQGFAPRIALHTALDVLAASSTPDALHNPKEVMEPLARIALGHAMQSPRKAWACKFGHPESDSRWRDMTLVAWQDPGGWNVAIAPRDNPILFSDYHWQETDKGLVFYDRLPSDAPSDTMQSRGSYERYGRSQHTLASVVDVHWDSAKAMLSSSIVAVEPDTAWTKPVKAALKKELQTSKSISPEYYSFMRSFEEKAFDYLSAKAVTPDALALGMRMTVGRSLDAPGKTIGDFQARLAAWGTAMEGAAKKEEMVVDGNLFEGLGL